MRKAFKACVAGLEAGDASGATEVLASGFQGPEGMDKAAVRLYLLALLRKEKVGVTVLGDRIEVRGREALQSVEVLLTSRSPGGGFLPQETSRRTYLLHWRLEGGDWKLSSLQEGGS